MDKAEVLMALCNKARRQGMGTLISAKEPLRKEDAEELLKVQTYFDYLGGRVLKVDLSGDEFNPVLYDRDNGQGAAARALEHLK